MKVSVSPSQMALQEKRTKSWLVLLAKVDRRLVQDRAKSRKRLMEASAATAVRSTARLAITSYFVGRTRS